MDPAFGHRHTAGSIRRVEDAENPRMTEHELELEQVQAKLAAYAALGSAAATVVAVGLYVMAMKGADVKSKASILATSHEHSAQLIFSGLFRAVAFALLAIVLGFLAGAARRRAVRLPALTVPVAYAGPALMAVAAPLAVLAQIKAASIFAEGAARTDKAAELALGGSLVTVAQYASVFAVMLLAVSWIVTGLYCMRVGLLTRIVGGVAIAIGVLGVMSVYGPSVLGLVIQFFWLTAVAVMLLATEETRPPAWKLGAAVTWREVDAARAGNAPQPSESEPESES